MAHIFNGKSYIWWCDVRVKLMFAIVALDLCWILSRRVAGFLHGRHVLFPNVQHGRKFWNSSLHCRPLIFGRISNSFFASMPTNGAIRPSVIRPTPVCWDSFPLFPVYGVQSSAFAVTTTQAMPSHICSIWENTQQLSSST